MHNASYMSMICVHYMQLGVQYMYRAFTNKWKTVIPITVSVLVNVNLLIQVYIVMCSLRVCM